MKLPQSQAVRHTLASLGTAAALAAVFATYLQPDFMVQLAQQVWTCF